MRFSKMIAASFTGLVLVAGMGGCAAQHQEVIPSTARLQMSGSGQKVYSAPSDGTMYVYDQPADRLLWSGQVKSGQVVGVDPARSEITLNGSTVSNKTQVGNGRIDMFFEPSPTLNSSSANATLTPARTTTNGDGTATVTGSGSYTVQPPPVTVTPSVRVEQQPVPANCVVTPTTPAADPGK